jgi:hypothetical protein
VADHHHRDVGLDRLDRRGDPVGLVGENICVSPSPWRVTPKGPTSPPHCAADTHGVPSGRNPKALWMSVPRRSPAIARSPANWANARSSAKSITWLCS